MFLIMKAAVLYRYGKPELLTVANLPTPEIKQNELLIHNAVAAINPYDCMVRSGAMWFMEGFRFPKILGGECAGRVVKVGETVRNYKVGDRVVVLTGRSRAYAEYVVATELMLAPLPENITYSEGAALPIAGCTAYDALYKLGNLKAGQQVLIYGAYGSVGSYAVQLAKLEGATVTAVCSAPNLHGVQEIGADYVIDYTTTEISVLKKKFDIILDTPSVLKFSRVREMLSQRGVYIATLPSRSGMFNQALTSFQSKKSKTIFADPNNKKIKHLINLVSNRKLKVILDTQYPIEQIAEAHAYSETKRAKGKITITF